MQSAHEAAGAAGIRRSPRPPWAEGNSNASDASRREIADARLDLFCCLKIVSEIQSAQHSLTTLHKTHPSCPDLIRASINLRHKFFRRWITGSASAKTRFALSPGETISIDMKAASRPAHRLVNRQ